MIKKKPLNQLRAEWKYLSVISPFMETSPLTSYSMVRTRTFSSKIRNKTRCPLSSLLFYVILKAQFIVIREEKEIGTERGQE
jgi:hypothetical protein